MKKIDARVRYTQTILKKTLLTLLEKKPINKITVKEVCELAELNRATFYTHYTDCFALLESIENDMLEDFTQSLQYIRSLDVSSLLNAIYDMADKNDKACRILIFQGDDRKVLGKMVALAREKSIDYWKSELTHANDEELSMLYTHLSNGLLHVVVDGFGKYCREDMTHFVNKVVHCTLDAFK